MEVELVSSEKSVLLVVWLLFQHPPVPRPSAVAAGLPPPLPGGVFRVNLDHSNTLLLPVNQANGGGRQPRALRQRFGQQQHLQLLQGQRLQPHQTVRTPPWAELPLAGYRFILFSVSFSVFLLRLCPRPHQRFTSCTDNHGIRPPPPEQYLTPLQQKEVCIRHLRARLKDTVDTLQDR